MPEDDSAAFGDEDVDQVLDDLLPGDLGGDLRDEGAELEGFDLDEDEDDALTEDSLTEDALTDAAPSAKPFKVRLLPLLVDAPLLCRF